MIPELDRLGDWTCSADIDRILAGGKRRRLGRELDCIECGPDAVVIEAGATASALEHPLQSHEAIVVTMHGIDRDATPDEVHSAVGPVVGRAFARLHDRYFRLGIWWTVEQSGTGVVNVHALTLSTGPIKRSTMRAAFTEAADLGLRPAVESEPVRRPLEIAAYALKIPLFAAVTSDPRDAMSALRYGLTLNGGVFAHHIEGFFGDPGEPWTDAQIRGRGQRRASAVVRWARAYDKYPEKLPPLLVGALKDPPWRRPEAVAGIADEFVLDDESAAFILDGLEL